MKNVIIILIHDDVHAVYQIETLGEKEPALKNLNRYVAEMRMKISSLLNVDGIKSLRVQVCEITEVPDIEAATQKLFDNFV